MQIKHKKIKNLIFRIKNKQFLYILKRIFLPFFPHIYGMFYMENRFIYNFFISPHWTKFLKLPNDYAYILAGSHGVGFAAFIKYFEIINANPMPLNKMFSSLDSVLLYKKQARKNANKIYGITFDKSYMDNTRRNILKKFKKRVIVFCLVRDPISIIKTHTHHHVINILIDSLDEEGNLKISNENKTKIFNKITNMIMFLASNIIEKSKIKPFFCFTSLLQNIQDSIQKVIYVDTSQIQGEAAYYTMRNIALDLNLEFNHAKRDFNINYSLVLKNIIKNIFPYKQNLEIHNIPIIYDLKLDSNNAYITDFALGGGRKDIYSMQKIPL